MQLSRDKNLCLQKAHALNFSTPMIKRSRKKKVGLSARRLHRQKCTRATNHVPDGTVVQSVHGTKGRRGSLRVDSGSQRVNSEA